MIPYGQHYLDDDDIQAVAGVLRSGALTQGPKVAEFERAIADYVGARYAVAVSSGTAALHLACIAANVGTGDNVVTSPNTFVASANCACYVGARPAFADIEEGTLNLDPAALAAECRKLGRVKAVIPVHFAGLPCDMPAIKRVADDYNAVIIEDAAHALGATYADGGRVGNCACSAMTVFSFHPVKLIAAGEGGMITTNDEETYHRLLRLRSHGITKADYEFIELRQAFDGSEVNPWYYEMQELGFNYRITDIHCVLALSQFSKLNAFLERRRAIASEYDRSLGNLALVGLPQAHQRARSANHLYVLRIEYERLGRARREIMRDLAGAGIGTQVHYIPVHLQPYYQRLGYRRGQFPVAERYYEGALTIPLYYGMSDETVRAVISAVRGVVTQQKQPSHN